MQARELAKPYPTVTMDTTVAAAARLISEGHLPGVIVVDENQHPIAILPGSQVLRLVIPQYILDDPRLAAVLEESDADHICDTLEAKTVAQALPRDHKAVPTVAPDDTVLEIAALMAANRTPLVAVVEARSKTAPLIGVVTAAELLARLLPDQPSGAS